VLSTGGWARSAPDDQQLDHAHRELRPASLRGEVKRGELGKKSGKGFYEWKG
jgi:3-hydroxyacyl-CoA dehydrogenase